MGKGDDGREDRRGVERGPWTGGGHRGARSPSSSSSAWWKRFGALARQVGDRSNAGRPVGAEERSESLSPASESLDRKRVLDKRVEPDMERDMELDRKRLLPLPCLLPCPCLARRRLWR